MKYLGKLILIIVITMTPIKSRAQYDFTKKWLEENYTKREVMIPMRDGNRLYTSIYEPVDTSESHPILMLRTPYSIRPYGKGFSSNLRGYLSIYVKHSYIIVIQNVRGTYLSEGEYENIRPYRSESVHIDEATDVYDTAEWLVKNTNNNGSIGVKGSSYPGFYATWAGLSNHPAIKAVSPQAPVTDWFIGDDVHRNGAFCLADMYGFGGSFFRVRKNPTIRGAANLVKIPEDISIYRFFKNKPMSELMKPFGDSLPMWNNIKNHPQYDSFWKERNPVRHFKNIKPAVLVVGGFYDAEDCYGAFKTYRGIRENSPETELYFVNGPWAHGSWRDLSYRTLDGADFGEGTARYFLTEIEYPFFAYYLENKGDKPASSVMILPSGDTRTESEKPSWQAFDVWPPKNRISKKYYLSEKSTLTDQPPVNSEYSYISDPSNPVPYYHLETPHRERDYMAGDQRFLDRRKDVLTFSLAKQKEDVKFIGGIRVSLNLSVSTTDADIIVKIIDERPDGYKQLVRWEVLPLRFRKGLEKGIAMIPGKMEKVDFEMQDIAHVLKKGHSLLVQIQSSMFPLLAMNPQTFLENQFNATENDYKKCEVTVFSDKKSPSFIEFSILP